MLGSEGMGVVLRKTRREFVALEGRECREKNEVGRNSLSNNIENARDSVR